MFAGLVIAVPVLGSTVSAAEEAEEDDGGGDLSQ